MEYTSLGWGDLTDDARSCLERDGVTEESWEAYPADHLRVSTLMVSVPWDSLHKELTDQLLQHGATKEDWEANRLERESIGFCAELEPRIMLTSQLKKIMEEADALNLNRQIDPVFLKMIDEEGIHLVSPMMVHRHAYGRVVNPHMRARIYIKEIGEERPAEGMIDIPMESFNNLQAVSEVYEDMGIPSASDSEWQKFIRDFWRVVGDKNE